RVVRRRLRGFVPPRAANGPAGAAGGEAGRDARRLLGGPGEGLPFGLAGGRGPGVRVAPDGLPRRLHGVGRAKVRERQPEAQVRDPGSPRGAPGSRRFGGKTAGISRVARYRPASRRRFWKLDLAEWRVRSSPMRFWASSTLPARAARAYR